MEQICVIGVGFVGEHLVDIFSKRYRVIGYDVAQNRVNQLKEIFKNNCNVIIQSSFDNMEHSKLFCIAVPTPLSDDGTINDSYIYKSIKLIEDIASVGSTVVMESSVHIGMTRKNLGHLRNKNIYVGFSPERVDPGRLDPPVDKIPKIISGIDEESLDQISYYYGKVFDNLVKVSSMEMAELCKLSENCFRMINIAYINEIECICQKWGINPYEMIKACSTKPFGYMPFYPGLGVGGYCIPVNPEWLAVTNRDDIPLLLTATEMMKNKPILEARKLLKTNIQKVLVVGLAFKYGESTTINSPGMSYANELLQNNIDVTLYDPLVEFNNPPNCMYNFLKMENWNSDYIDNTFDVVCIAIKQKNIDMKILDGCHKVKIIKYCE